MRREEDSLCRFRVEPSVLSRGRNSGFEKVSKDESVFTLPQALTVL